MAHLLLPLDLRIDQAISEVALATDRLALRPLRGEDRALLRGACREAVGDRLAAAMLAEEAVAEVCARAEAEWQATGLGDLLVFRIGEPAPIGLIRLAPLADGTSGRMAAITYQINGTFRGRGYATEAVGAALGYAFDEARLDYVIACIEPDNGASLRVAERNGLVRIAEGRVGGRLVRRLLISAAGWQVRRRFTGAAPPPGLDLTAGF